jgi:hypothetical protein
MCFYIPEFNEDDELRLKSKNLPKRVTGANSAAVFVFLEGGQKFKSGIWFSGTEGGHLDSVYGKAAWKGHKNDAEIMALAALPSIPDECRGTVYLVGSGGPCQSCAEVMNVLRTSHKKLQVKILYITPPEISLTQDEKIRYGWFNDKLAFIGSTKWFYHYIPAKSCPNPLNERERYSLAYGRKQVELQLKHAGKTLASCLDVVATLQLKKAAAAALDEEIRASLFRITVAGNAWGERRRFGREDGETAYKNVVSNYDLTEIERTEFSRRLKNAREENFGNWRVPAD